MPSMITFSDWLYCLLNDVLCILKASKVLLAFLETVRAALAIACIVTTLKSWKVSPINRNTLHH